MHLGTSVPYRDERTLYRDERTLYRDERTLYKDERTLDSHPIIRYPEGMLPPRRHALRVRSFLGTLVPGKAQAKSLTE